MSTQFNGLANFLKEYNRRHENPISNNEENYKFFDKQKQLLFSDEPFGKLKS